jgi:hypothetical protein
LVYGYGLMACREGCRTKDHASYAACLNSSKAGVMMGSQQRSRTEVELQAYRDARKAGIQPAGTRMHAIDAANAVSDKYGAAFNAEDGTVGGKPPALIEAGV